MRISNELPSAFQEKIREEYPQYQTQFGQEVLAVDPREKFSMPPIHQLLNAHTFISEKNTSNVTIAHNYFYFSTSTYLNWIDFKERLFKVLRQFEDIYAPQSYIRIGLRYLDLFVRSEYNLTDKKWTELVHPQFLSQLSNEYADDNMFNNVCDVKFKDSSERARIITAVVSNPKGQWPNNPNAEKCLLFDTDVYTLDRVSTSDGEVKLDRLHEYASKMFHSIPTPMLKDAMGPIQ